jgi:hypothetical protein
MELTGNEIVMSVDDLWSTVSEYVIYLRNHNLTTRLEELFDSIHYHQEYYGRGLQPMLEVMSKHGMPDQFPADGSHLNQPATFRCLPNGTSSAENSLITTSEYW